MAIISPVATSIAPTNRLTQIIWSAMANSDSGAVQGLLPGPDRSIQITGTFGAGGTVILEGSNDLSAPTNWFTLRDPLGTSLSFTAAGLRQVLETTLWIRPRVTAGDGTTALTVSMLLSRSAGV